MYSNCDCPPEYRYTSDAECWNSYNGGETKIWCSYSSSSNTPYSHTKETCPQAIVSARYGCATRTRGTLYKCGCSAPKIVGNSCVTNYCGDPSRGSDDTACWEGNYRISTYNGGNSTSDQTCQCREAKTASQLGSCRGGGPSEYVYSCKYERRN